MPSYFGREMSESDYRAQLIADQIALAYAEALVDGRLEDAAALQIEALDHKQVPRPIWDDTVARARRVFELDPPRPV